MSASLGGGYDDGLGEATGSAAELSGSAGYGQFSGGLAYGLHRGRLELAASLDSSARYYTPLADHLLFAHAGNIAASWQIAQGTRLSVRESLAYQPLLALATFPILSEGIFGQRDRVGLDAGLRRDEYLTHATAVDLSQRVSRRGTFTASYEYRTNQASGDGVLSAHSGGARYSLALSRDLSLRLGYGLSEARYPGAAHAFRNHNIDAGLGFTRALGASRRTTIAFSSGAAAVEDGSRREYRAIGDAQLRREIGRTWNASAGYRREVQYLETFSAPVFADAMTIAVGGQINRRAQFRSQFSAALASLALTRGDNGFNTYSSTTGLVFGLSRYLALGVDYTVFHYAFHADAPVVMGLARQLTRHGVMSSLSLWLPIVETARRSDASR